MRNMKYIASDLKKEEDVMKKIFKMVSVGMVLLFVTACGMIGENTGNNTENNTGNNTEKIVAENISEEVTPLEIEVLDMEMLNQGDNQERTATAEFMDFSVEVMRILQEEETGENLLIAPYSIITALSLTANGAKGETLEQMESVLGVDVTSLNEFLYAYSNNLPTEETCKVNVANSIWVKEDDGLSVDEEFLSIGKSYYNGAVYRAAFDETTRADINNWVYHETDGMIEEILDKIDEDAVMYLVNALSFDAEWDEIYYEDQVRDGEFTTADGEVQTVEFLHSEESEYLELEDAVGVVKPYAGGDFSFVAILPDEDGTISLDEFVAGLDSDELIEALDSTTMVPVITSIPKFSYEYDTELSEVLEGMGMIDAFNEEKADFEEMILSENGNVYINRVLHKTFISVDEKGTEAGAATVVEMTEETMGIMQETKEVRLDRPFFFMIVDNELHLPIFMGTVESL